MSEHLIGVYDSTNVNLTISGNRVSNNAPTTGLGDGIEADEVTTSTVLVEKNVVDGGGPTNAGTNAIGIIIQHTDGVSGVTVQRNTARDFDTANSGFGAGIFVDDAPNTQVLRNALQNNDVGVEVDAFGGFDSAGTVVNFNNITGNPATQVGLDFNAGGSASADLDARNNFWGAASGPGSVEEGADTCPEATGATCTTPQPGAADGTGMPVANNDVTSADCEDGNAAAQVITCPFRTMAVFGAGARVMTNYR